MSVQSAVQAPPAGRISPVTCLTPLPVPSAAEKETVIVPRTTAGRPVTEDVGALLSTVRVRTVESLLPAPSVAVTRSS